MKRISGYFNLMKVIFKSSIKDKLLSQNWKYIYIFTPILNTLLYLYMYNLSNSNKNILIDISLVILWSINIFYSTYLIIDDRELGLLASTLTSNYSLNLIYFFKTLATMILNITTIIVVFLIGYLTKGLILDNIVFNVIAYIFSIFSISTIGLLISITMMYTRNTRGLMSVIEYPFFILSGLFISLSFMPAPFRIISYMLPTTYSFEMFNCIALNNLNLASKYALKAIFINIIYHIVIYKLFAKCQQRIIYKGDMDLY